MPSANENSASREVGSATRPRSTTNENSAFQEASSATRTRSTANRNSLLAGNRPGTNGSVRSTPVEHPQTFLRLQHPQHPRFWTNQNSERRFDPDHPKFRSVYKLAQPSIQQDYTNRFHRDSISGSGLSSPALQRTPQDSFSGSPPGHLNKKLLTDPQREERIAEGSRPGLVFPLPRWIWTLPHLKLLPLAVLNGLPRRLDGWRILAAQNHPRGVDRARPGTTHANEPGTARREYTGPRSAHHTAAAGVNSSLPPGINKESLVTWYKRGIDDDPV